MYKQIGFQFNNIRQKELDILLGTIRGLESHYMNNGLEEYVSPPGKNRDTSRMRVMENLPDELKISIWFMFQDRFRKTSIKDISETGAGVVLPFADRNDVFKEDRPFTALIEIGEGNPPLGILCKSVVRYDREIHPPEEIKEKFTEVFNHVIHPSDVDYSGWEADQRLLKDDGEVLEELYV